MGCATQDWWACSGLNREPRHYECHALTIELQARHNQPPRVIVMGSFRTSMQRRKSLYASGLSARNSFCAFFTKSSGVADHHHEFALARAPFGGFQQLGRRAAQEFLEFLG